MTTAKQPTLKEIKAIQDQTRVTLNQLKQREVVTIRGLKKLLEKLYKEAV